MMKIETMKIKNLFINILIMLIKIDTTSIQLFTMENNGKSTF
jgi:hypothetical protein